MVGYLDDYTRPLYIGVDVNNAQFMTEFALATIVQDDEAWLLKKDGEFLAYQIEGQLRRIPSLPDSRDRRRRSQRLRKFRKDHCHAKESGPGWTLPEASIVLWKSLGYRLASCLSTLQPRC